MTFSFVKNLGLEVAYELMCEAHAGQTRKDGVRPAREHPELVRDILAGLGADSVQQAVGLLHDVVEDNRVAFADAGVLYKKLIERMAPRLPAGDSAAYLEMMAWVADVCQGVEELTNDAILYEGKRSWQVDNAAYMQNHFKPVKVIDQAASVIDGLRHAKPEDFPFEKGFALKGLDVATACDSPECRPCYEFYKHAFACLREYIFLVREGRADEAAELRRGFDIHQKIAESLNPADPVPRHVDRVTHVFYHDAPLTIGESLPSEKWPDHPPQGLERVTLAEGEDFVVGFGMVVSQNGNNPLANRCVDQFRTLLESPPGSDHWNRVQTGPVALHFRGLETHDDDVLVRDFTLKPRVRLAEFLELANRVQAVDPAFAAALSQRIAPTRSIGRA